MLISKNSKLKPLLESQDGVHLTAYLVNRSDLEDLKRQLKLAIEEAYEWLNPVMSLDERRRFLEPLEALVEDCGIISQMKGNIGLFRTADMFRVLNIPVDVEPSCNVATSFHVKPILRWLQVDREFLLLGIERDSAHLYLGSQDSFRLLDSISIPDLANSSRSSKKITRPVSSEVHLQSDDAFRWLDSWVNDLTLSSKMKLFLAGNTQITRKLLQYLKYKNIVKTPIASSFDSENFFEVCAKVREIVKEESDESLEKALMEFRFAEEGNRTQKNIFQISKAVVQGKVRKLIVTDELSIFGKIDKKSGGLSIHPFDLDHEDDDILDDLAQMVLSQGGEVVIANRDDIPKGRPILAILEHESSDKEKTEDFYSSQASKERFT